MYLKAASLLNTPIEECYIFEDSKSGLIAARRAGAKKVIRVLSMARREKGIDCDLEIENYTELNCADYR